MTEPAAGAQNLGSVVVPVTDADVDLEEIVEGYSRPLREAGYPFEIVLVLDGVGQQLTMRAEHRPEGAPAGKRRALAQ